MPLTVNTRSCPLTAVNGCYFVTCRRWMAVNSLLAETTLPRKPANWTHPKNLRNRIRTLLEWHVCRTKLARNIFVEAQIFSRKMLRDCPPEERRANALKTLRIASCDSKAKIPGAGPKKTIQPVVLDSPPPLNLGGAAPKCYKASWLQTVRNHHYPKHLWGQKWLEASQPHKGKSYNFP